ncbi:MAG: DUF4157 domain-containing protein [Moorea sp. SIO4G3]|nr:DUF4157 domain-containing protein [Moorena sp. SIO4G3]
MGRHGLVQQQRTKGIPVAPREGGMSGRETPIQRQEEEKKPENKTGLPDRLKDGIESLSGYDLSGVRVNYNSPKPAQLNAHAYTQGLGIEVAPGQKRHLPHEAWHVVQQMQGRVRPTMEVNGVGVNGDRGLEREAEVMGKRGLHKREAEGEKPKKVEEEVKEGKAKESRRKGDEGVLQKQVVGNTYSKGNVEDVIQYEDLEGFFKESSETGKNILNKLVNATEVIIPLMELKKEFPSEKKLAEYIGEVYDYVDLIERYNHLGYDKTEDTRGRKAVENKRIKLIQAYESLDNSALQKLVENKLRWEHVYNLEHVYNSKHYNRYDPKLIYYHANNIKTLQPLASVSYGEEVSGKHQNQIKNKLYDDNQDKKRNYATLKYEIKVFDTKRRNPGWLLYEGSYAGRSGEYNSEHQISVPDNGGKVIHQVASTLKTYSGNFQTFIDHHDRANDSEVAIFNHLDYSITKDLRKRGINTYQSIGKISLKTDRATCNSCSAVAMTFQQKWATDVQVIHGGIYDGKRYGGWSPW